MTTAHRSAAAARLAQGDQLIARLEETIRELDEIYVEMLAANRQTRRHIRELLEHARRRQRNLEQEVQHAQDD